MLVGHIGAAMVAKQAAPRVSFGTFALAALAADILLFTFVLTGLEDVRFRTSTAAAAYYAPLQVAFSHSLATMGQTSSSHAASSGSVRVATTRPLYSRGRIRR